jgi:Skp family chaperone for outer membrane proteins
MTPTNRPEHPLARPGSLALILTLSVGLGLLCEFLPAQVNGAGSKPLQKTGKTAKTGTTGKTVTPADAGATHKKVPKLTSLRIAMVNVRRATTGHPLWQVRNGELSTWARAESARIGKLEQSLQGKRAELPSLERGSKAADQIRKEIEIEDYALRVEKRRFQDALGVRNNRLLLELQTHVYAAVSELAAKGNIHLVLRQKPDLTKDGAMTQIRLNQDMDVLYAAASLDITDDVIDFLKAKYPAK